MQTTTNDPHVIDINNPPKVPYKFQEFPTTVYHHKTGHVKKVFNADELQAAKKRGFKSEPSPDHDYSHIQNGRAATKVALAQAAKIAREAALKAAGIVTLDEEPEPQEEVSE